MKKAFTPLLAAALLSLAFSILSCSPVNKGFKHYRSKDYEKAEANFRKSIDKRPQEAPVSRLGLFYLRQRDVFQPNSPYRTIEEAFLDVKDMKTAFDSLPEAKKAWFKKKKHIQVSESDYNIILARAQRQAMERIRVHDSLLLLDTFAFYMMPLNERLEDDYAALEDSLTMHNLRSWHYYTLRSVARNHSHVLTARQLRLPPSWYDHLVEAFLREYPLSGYRRVVDDFPTIPATQDCYIDEFLAAVESRKLEHLAAFLSTCHQSNMDEVVTFALLMPPNKYLLGQKSGLPEEALKRIEEIQQTGYWIYRGFDFLPPREVVAQVKAQMDFTAPANRSYILLIEALRHLRALGEWELSLELVQYAQPLFPDEGDLECLFPSYVIHNKREIWFEKMIARLQQPAEGPAVFPLAEPANTRLGDEFRPVVTIDDENLWLGGARRSINIKKEDVFRTSRQDTAWAAPAVELTLSGQGQESPLSITADEDKMLLSIEGRLFLSERESPSSRWNRPRQVSSAVNDFPWVGAGTISRDGKVIIFEASDDPKPFENEENIDLYISVYDEEEEFWSIPERLGGNINTPQFQERSPHLHADNRTLLFSSGGHFGFAEMDVFMATRQGDSWLNWSAPRNLGKEVNGYDNDWQQKFSLPASGKKAYLSSKIALSESPADLIEANLPTYGRPPRVLVMKGNIAHQTGATRVRAKPVYPTTGEVIDSCRVLPGGDFRLLLPDEGRERVFIYADDPAIYSTIIELEMADIPDVLRLERSPYTIPIATMAAKEIPIPLEKVHFEPGSTALSAEFRQELDWVAHYFAGNRQTILIGGHTDGEGSAAEQEALSLARAEAVKAYLITLGMDWDRMWTQGFADKKPAEKGENRRVEIYVKKP